MSLGLIRLKSAPMTPSITTSGKLSPDSEFPPRSRMRSSEPGCAFVVCTCIPGTRPARAWSARSTGFVAISGPVTEETEPVRSGNRDESRSEEHTAELQSHHDLVSRLQLEQK